MSKLRVLKVTAFYKEYIRQSYRGGIVSSISPYQTQFEALFESALLPLHTISRYLNAFPELEVIDVIANADSLQAKWAEEHHVAGASNKNIVWHQIRHYRPDIVFIHDWMEWTSLFIQELRSSFPFIQKIICYHGGPLEDKRGTDFRAFDYVITASEALRSKYTAFGVHSHAVLHSFDPRVLDLLRDYRSEVTDTFRRDASQYDIVYCGSLFAGDSLHNERLKVITSLVRHGVSMKVFGLMNAEAKTALLDPQSDLYCPTLMELIEPPVFGLDMFAILSASRTVFNCHIDVAESSAGNMRMFEATGVGACLFTDWKSNLPDLFDPESDLICYRNAEDAVMKSERIRSRAYDFEKIAKSGQARTLAEHKLSDRASQLRDIILQSV